MITLIHEHYNGLELKKFYDFSGQLPLREKDYCYQFTRKKRNQKIDCYRIYSDFDKQEHSISNTYFIGVDWIIENEKAIYIQPKLNVISKQTDYLRMLFSALQHPEVANFTDDLFEIKWDSTPIEITQEQDLLTPLLVVQYLKAVQTIVKKGLKKSYYRVEQNLFGKVKGKVLIGQTIKQNLLKNKTLHTYCNYDEFGLNGLENRLLKKALIFVQRYLPTFRNPKADVYTENVFNYINPAFEFISEEVSLNEVKNVKTNAFYKEYEEAIKLAKLILKRFGYNITNANSQEKITTPPFWIDMSKLFELYVYGHLKNIYGNKILYGKNEAGGNYGLPDYLFNQKNNEMVIDAKYKPIYQKDNYDIDNIRQLSGYARDQEIISKLQFDEHKVIPCLIIYPTELTNETEAEFKIDLTKKRLLNEFSEFYLLGVPIPQIKKKNEH